MAAGAWIANISRTHALYVEGDGYQVRLPRMEHDGEPANGWFVHAGTALVGSRAMLDDGQSLVVTVTGQYQEPAASGQPGRRAGWADEAELAGAGLDGAGLAGAGAAGAGLDGAGLAGAGAAGAGAAGAGLAGAGLADEGEWTDEVYAASTAAQPETEDAGRAGAGLAYAGLAYTEPAEAGQTGELDGPGLAARDGDGTLLPFYLDPMTKLFLVALIWCRPWLVDPSATRPLPRTPEIARGALEVTGAYHELERFDADPEYRDLLSARVAEHIKVLRRKIADRGLAAADVRLSDEVAVRILIEHGIITSADLSPAGRPRLALPPGGPLVDPGLSPGR